MGLTKGGGPLLPACLPSPLSLSDMLPKLRGVCAPVLGPCHRRIQGIDLLQGTPGSFKLFSRAWGPGNGSVLG